MFSAREIYQKCSRVVTAQAQGTQRCCGLWAAYYTVHVAATTRPVNTTPSLPRKGSEPKKRGFVLFGVLSLFRKADSWRNRRPTRSDDLGSPMTYSTWVQGHILASISISLLALRAPFHFLRVHLISPAALYSDWLYEHPHPPRLYMELLSLILKVLAGAVTLLSAPHLLDRVLTQLSWMLPLGAGIA